MRIDEGARFARDDDVSVLIGLVSQAVAEKVAQRGGEVWSLREARRQPIETSLRDDLRNADVLLVVGTIDEEVVGYGTIRLTKLHNGTFLGRIVDLYVLPEARGVGVGEAMVNRRCGVVLLDQDGLHAQGLEESCDGLVGIPLRWRPESAPDAGGRTLFDVTRPIRRREYEEPPPFRPPFAPHGTFGETRDVASGMRTAHVLHRAVTTRWIPAPTQGRPEVHDRLRVVGNTISGRMRFRQVPQRALGR